MRMYIRNYDANRDLILSALKKGMIFAYPTDTIFGLGVDALNPEAVESLYRLKQRPKKLPFSIMVPNLDMILGIVSIPDYVGEFLSIVFPGPVTAVLPLRNPHYFKSGFLTDRYVGFRIIAHPFCRWLAKNYPNPIVTTSANLSGMLPLLTIDEIERTYMDKINLYIDDPVPDFPRFNNPSTVFKILGNGKIKILREGQIPGEELVNIYYKIQGY